MQANSMMTPDSGHPGQGRGSPWRPVVWGAAVVLELLPLVAMQFTGEVNWTGLDFLVFGIMLLLACGSFELGLRLSDNSSYRAGVALAVLAAFLLVWINLAVGVIGDEHNPANLMFAAVLAVGILGALLCRFRASGMVRALVATAFTQMTVGVVVQARLVDYEAAAVVLCAVFSAIWLASAALFARAARQQDVSGVSR